MTEKPIATKLVITLPNNKGKNTFSKLKLDLDEERLYTAGVNINMFQSAKYKYITMVEDVQLIEE